MALSIEEQQKKLFAQSLRNFLAPINPLLDDDSVSEIMINGPKNIYVERSGKIFKTEAQFKDDHTLAAAVRNIAQFVGRQLNETSPRMDARLPDGSRVHAIIPPLSKQGTVVAIRKFSREKLTLEKLIEFGALTPRAVQFIDALRKNAQNLHDLRRNRLRKNITAQLRRLTRRRLRTHPSHRRLRRTPNPKRPRRQPRNTTTRQTRKKRHRNPRPASLPHSA